MKRLISLCFFVLLAIGAFAQQKDVTTFLGIPVDGTKAAMKQKLIAKGFTPKKLGNNEYFEGEFNGRDVRLYIVTNNNKVYRIYLCDAQTSDVAHIKIRFNNLVNQFKNNKRYFNLDGYTLSDEEDISYEMSANKKVYEAAFCQWPNWEKIDTTTIRNKALDELSTTYTKEQLNNPTEYINEEISKAEGKIMSDLLYKKMVWFRIEKSSYGEYYIAMYYDNKYNQANGEDL